MSSRGHAASGGAVLRVGLTGSIGAGKSVVGRVLADDGCLVLDADHLAREVLQPGSAAVDEIVEAFGDGIRTPEGGIDRAALAAVAFAHPDARRRLEEITHPRIRRLEEERVRAWASAGRVGIAVTEAALLVETGGADRYHRLVVVLAPVAVRRRRLLDRGHGPDDVERRMAAQLPQARKLAAADYAVDNGGRLEATRAAARRLLSRLREDRAALAAGESLPRRP